MSDLPTRLRDAEMTLNLYEYPDLASSCIEAADELEDLRRWKREATIVLGEWEKVWLAAGQPGPIGPSKARNLLRWVENRTDTTEGWEPLRPLPSQRWSYPPDTRL
jgi:hypothetical protein